jgi:hypothetical protein
MKKKLYAAFIISVLLMSIAPAFNLHDALMTQETVKWWKRKVLYNMDFFYAALSRLSYPYGVSIDPSQAIIGKEGWLFLGDGFSNSISSKRMGDKAENSLTRVTVADSAKAWDQWLTEKKVAAFRIVIGPDKDSVYSEYLPNWSAHASARPTDALIREVSANIHIDPTEALIRAKTEYSELLYYKTDTHWNNLGALIAFDELRKNLTDSGVQLSWPRTQESLITESHQRNGGDLAKFLWIQDELTDHEVVLNLGSLYELPVEHHDFDKGQLVFSGRNIGIASPKTPLLVKSERALNKKKVLWIRDSFGVAVAPLMAATFSETLQIHYLSLKAQAFAELVERYQPDFVFVTGVERDIRSDFFQSMPPSPTGG